MRIIPVIDILDGIAVHAFAGQRRWYRPVQSVLTNRSDPAGLLDVICRRYAVRECYLADIDRIQGRPLNEQIVQDICRLQVDVMLEAGIRHADDVNALPLDSIRQIVVGSETLTSLSVLRSLAGSVGSDRVVFSLDLRRGELITANPDWLDEFPLDVARQVADAGVSSLILLDLAAVGTGGGVRSLDLFRRIRAAEPGLQILVGGGIRTTDDLRQLQDAGVDGVLMASAFHNGSLSPTQLQALRATVAAGDDSRKSGD